MNESKLPTLDAALTLVILRVTLGALFVSTFFENLGKELYSAKGYAGLIRYYIQYGHAPAVWKQVMGLMAANSAIAGPGQGFLKQASESSLSWVSSPGLPRWPHSDFLLGYGSQSGESAGYGSCWFQWP